MKKLKTVEEHEAEKTEQKRLHVGVPGNPTGIACPKCGAELFRFIGGIVVQLGGSVYHRISPAVVVWFEYAFADLDATTPPPSPGVVAEVVAAQDAICRFARDRLTASDLDAARAHAKAHGPRPLPDPPPDATF